MKGKLLIVEDEPIVALDLREELQHLGCDVVAIAESADEALVAAELFKPDLVLMDIRIVGSMDGIQTARLMRELYEVPSVFLTSYSDEATITRAIHEMPYGFLTKPYNGRELNATLQVALHKAFAEALHREHHRAVESTVAAVPDALIAISLEGYVQFMNPAAETLTGRELQDVRGKQWEDVLKLNDSVGRTFRLPHPTEEELPMKALRWALPSASKVAVQVSMSVSPMLDAAGGATGYLISLESRAEGHRDRTPQDRSELAGSKK